MFTDEELICLFMTLPILIFFEFRTYSICLISSKKKFLLDLMSSLCFVGTLTIPALHRLKNFYLQRSDKKVLAFACNTSPSC